MIIIYTFSDRLDIKVVFLVGLVLTNAMDIPKSLKHNAILILQYCHVADGCHHSQHFGCVTFMKLPVTYV